MALGDGVSEPITSAVGVGVEVVPGLRITKYHIAAPASNRTKTMTSNHFKPPPPPVFAGIFTEDEEMEDMGRCGVIDFGGAGGGGTITAAFRMGGGTGIPGVVGFTAAKSSCMVRTCTLGPIGWIGAKRVG